MLDLKKDIKDIQDNKITSLDYRNVNISNIEGLELAEALQNNYSVKSIIIDAKKLDVQVLNAIVISCTNNLSTTVNPLGDYKFGLDEEFNHTANPAKKYHIYRCVTHGLEWDGSFEMLTFAQEYKQKATSKILKVLACPAIYNNGAKIKKVMSFPLLEKDVYVDIGRMIDQDTCISFKMAMDDALYNRQIGDTDSHEQVELGGESSDCILL